MNKFEVKIKFVFIYRILKHGRQAILRREEVGMNNPLEF